MNIMETSGVVGLKSEPWTPVFVDSSHFFIQNWWHLWKLYDLAWHYYIMELFIKHCRILDHRKYIYQMRVPLLQPPGWVVECKCCGCLLCDVMVMLSSSDDWWRYEWSVRLFVVGPDWWSVVIETRCHDYWSSTTITITATISLRLGK